MGQVLGAGAGCVDLHPVLRRCPPDVVFLGPPLPQEWSSRGEAFDLSQPKTYIFDVK